MLSNKVKGNEDLKERKEEILTEMGIKKTNKFLLILLMIFVTSCDDVGVFDSYQTLENSIWNRDESIDFKFLVSDTIQKHNLYIMLRNNQEYEFSNLFLISKMSFPNGKKIVDTLQYAMADNKGNFLGKGLSYKESKLFYKENSIFPVSGNYEIKISQAMRKSGEIKGIDKLKGITDVGFRIEKVHPND